MYKLCVLVAALGWSISNNMARYSGLDAYWYNLVSLTAAYVVGVIGLWGLSQSAAPTRWQVGVAIFGGLCVGVAFLAFANILTSKGEISVVTYMSICLILTPIVSAFIAVGIFPDEYLSVGKVFALIFGALAIWSANH